MNEESTLTHDIRQVIDDHGRLAVPIGTLDDQDDLFRAGMTSHASVNVMLALEECFEVEFPEAMLRKSTFQSVAAIEAGVAELRSVPA
jgi:acyl carrier protein